MITFVYIGLLLENVLRYAAHFFMQVTADPGLVSKYYGLLATSNLLGSIFIFTIPLATQAAIKPSFITFYVQQNRILFIYAGLIGLVIGSLFGIDEILIVIFSLTMIWLGTDLALLRSVNKIKELTFIRLVNAAMYSSWLIWSVYLDFNFSLIALYIVLINSLCIIYIEKNFRHTRKIKLRKTLFWLNYIVKKHYVYILNSILLIAIISVDRITIAHVLSEIEVTKYAIATSLCAPIVIFGNAHSTIYFARILSMKRADTTQSTLLQINYGGLLLLLLVFAYSSAFYLSGFKQDRFPDAATLVSVAVYYYLYINVQYLLFLTSKFRLFIEIKLVMLFGCLLTYLLSTTVYEVLAILISILLFAIVFLSISIKRAGIRV